MTAACFLCLTELTALSSSSESIDISEPVVLGSFVLEGAAGAWIEKVITIVIQCWCIQGLEPHIPWSSPLICEDQAIDTLHECQGSGLG